VAVFPDRIVLKNSTDSQAAIEAAIGTGGTDEITQGEIVLGILNTDVKFYTKAGDGSIVSLGGTGTGPQNLGDLTDVDLSTPAADGQVIAYNSTSSNWEPVDQSGGLANIVEDLTPQLGGNLDTNSYYIVSTSGDVSLAPATGELVVRGGSSEGALTLNCTANTHGVTIKSPPHAQAATYTLVLPSGAGTAGQVLTSQGGAQLTWEDAGSGGATSINDLTDVDTGTTPPTQDQVLVWDGSTWVPGDQTGGSGGGGTDITTESIGALRDVEVVTGGSAAILWDDYNADLSANGRWRVVGNQLQFNKYDDQFVDQSATIDASPASGILLISQDGTNYSQYEYTSYQNGASSDWRYFDLVDASGITQAGNIYIKFGATGPSDGQVLTWVDTNGRWEPAAVSLGVNDLNDVAYPVTPATATWTGRWEVHTLTDNQCSPLGKVGPTTSFSGGVNLSIEDADGQNMLSNIGLNNLNLYYKLNNGSWTAVSNGSVQSACTPSNTVTESPVLRAVVLGAQVGDNLYLSDGLPETSSLPTDGQVLTWVDANNQWEPADAAGGSGSIALDDLTDVVAGVQPSSQTWSGTWTVDTLTSGELKSADGEMGYGSGDQVLLYVNDNSGTDQSANLSALNGSTVAWRKNSEAWQTETMTGYSVFGSTLVPLVAGLNASISAGQVGDNYTLADGPGGVDYTPTDGQVLTWVAANDQWEPADAASGGGGAVDSVNGETGVVSLGVQDMNDFELIPSGGPRLIYNTGHTGVAPPVGTCNTYAPSPSYIVLNPTDANGVDWYSSWTDTAIFDTGTVFSVKVNGVLQENITVGAMGTESPSRVLFQPQGWNFTALQDGDEVEFLIPTFPVDLVPLTDGDILQWNEADQKFKPAQLPIDILNDVDTSTTPPTDGQVLTWVVANNQWEPADAAGGAVDSVNGQTGDVSLGIQDMDDATVAAPAAGDLLMYSPSVSDESVILSFDSDYDNSGSGGPLTSTPYSVSLDSSEKKYGASSLALTTTSGSSVEYADSVAFDIPGDFTIEAWLWLDANTGSGIDSFVICTKRGSGYTDEHAYSFSYAPTGYTSAGPERFLFTIGSGSGGTNYNSNVYVMPAQQWVHCAVTLSSGTLTFYADGVAIGSHGGVGTCATTASPLRLGTYDASASAPQAWKIDDFAITKSVKYPGNFSPPGPLQLEAAGPQWQNVGSGATDGQVLTWVDANSQWEPGDYISKATLKAEVAASTDFADFQSRIAAL